ncbi:MULTISPECIES: S1 family peptidase [unclassified Lysobacter]|uniref:S1 family peptidase n=1 Tax=unclassified Lysobacter TaxID=2635362 RepID=UPI001BEC2089|nr:MULTISPECIES: S1 family peptidase [unclassified Lysobacter]MBT2746744.1 S1 family peptidase [Lysobacter sp. ISL-42]MBT2751793.1 S1 family peptidase [Lysobacter sp. ISL-50]MBT2778145.1 S1 family peptidase [Lysobacter sp. ISL-54]MBT2781786.1 S1 family peptidase [Lysobacter sp. ISL-52]
MQSTGFSPRRCGAHVFALSLLCMAAFDAAAATDLQVSPALHQAAQHDLGLSPARVDQLLQVQRDAPAQEALARRRLGAYFGGAWGERASDGSYRFVVGSSDPRGPLKLEGVQLRQVRYSLSELEAAKARLDRSVRMRVSGISRPIDGVHSWYVDPASNSVRVSVAPDAMERAIDLAAVSGADSGLLRFQQTPGVPQPTSSVYAGRAYEKNGALSCSVGFAVRQGATKGFVTAGHCGTAGETIGLDGAPAGYFAASEFPGTDRAWVALNANHELFPLITNYAGGFFSVRGSVEAGYSAVVCRSGWKTGYQCGFITGQNVTVNSTRGVVFGLTQTNACAGFGDSGGGWIDVYEQAQGVLSLASIAAGAQNNCGTGIFQVSWFQPVNPILQQYGLTLVTP